MAASSSTETVSAGAEDGTVGLDAGLPDRNDVARGRNVLRNVALDEEEVGAKTGRDVTRDQWATLSALERRFSAHVAPEGSAKANGDLMRTAGALNDVPLIVLTAGRPA